MKKALLGVGAAVLLAVAALLVRAALHPIDSDRTPPVRVRSDFFLLTDVLDQYHHDHGAYPTTEQGLDLLVTRGYLRKLPLDPWRNPYRYLCPGVHRIQAYDLWSTGADGLDGGEGAARDIANWGQGDAER